MSARPSEYVCGICDKYFAELPPGYATCTFSNSHRVCSVCTDSLLEGILPFVTKSYALKCPCCWLSKSSEDLLNKHGEESMKRGGVLTFDRSGGPLSYIDGKRNGLWCVEIEDNIRVEGMYHQGNLQGHMKIFSGTTNIEDAEFTDGVLNGWKRSWNALSNKLESEEYYLDGRKHGCHKKWHDNSEQIASETHYYSSRHHGVKKEWYENGAIQSEVTYVIDRKNGTEKLWSPDGVLLNEFQWVNGTKQLK